MALVFFWMLLSFILPHRKCVLLSRFLFHVSIYFNGKVEIDFALIFLMLVVGSFLAEDFCNYSVLF